MVADRRDHRRAGAGRGGADRVSRRRRRWRPAGSPTGRPSNRRRCCRRMTTPPCAPRSTPGCKRWPRRGWRRCWTARARRPNVSQGAVVVLDAASGAVRAMVGGRELPRQPVQPRRAGAPPAGVGVQAVRLAGGAGDRACGPDDTVLDAPIRIGNWSPDNFERRYLGEITVEEALAQSINTACRPPAAAAPAARALSPPRRARLRHRRQVAQQRLARARHRRGRAAGADRRLCAVLQWRATGDPVRVAPLPPTGDRGGGDHPPEQVIDPDLAAMMARMLAAVVSRGTGRAAAVPGRAVAGKTGTTQDFARCVVHRVVERGDHRGLAGQ